MGDYGDAMMRSQNAAVQARTKTQNRANVMQLKLVHSRLLLVQLVFFYHLHFGLIYLISLQNEFLDTFFFPLSSVVWIVVDLCLELNASC